MTSWFQQLWILHKKCFWVHVSSKWTTAFITLLPSLLAFISVYYVDTDPLNSFAPGKKIKVWNTSLCLSKGQCPNVFYYENNTSLGTSSLNSLHLNQKLGLNAVVQLPNKNALFQVYHQYRVNQTILPLAESLHHLFVGFNFNDDTSQIEFQHFTPPINEMSSETTVRVYAQFSALLTSALGHQLVISSLSNSHLPPPSNFNVGLRKAYDILIKQGAEANILANDSLTLVLISLLCFFHVTASRISREQRQGIFEMLSQWSIEDTAYLASHILSMVELLFLATALALFPLYSSRSYSFFTQGLGLFELFFIPFLLGCALIAYGAFIGVFVKRSFGVTMNTLFLFLQFAVGFMLYSDQILTFQSQPLILLLLFPYFAYIDLMFRVVMTKGYSTSLGDYGQYLGGSIIIYLILAIYVKKVHSKTHEIKHPWLFPFFPSYWKYEPLHESESDQPEEEVNLFQISKSYKENQVLSSISLTATTGRIYTLLGRNGAGKSTLMQILGGELLPTSGSCIVFGYDMMLYRKLLKPKIAFCAQENSYWDELSVSQHIQLFGSFEYPSQSSIDLEELLEEVGLEEAGKTLAKDLSGGMKRRLSLLLCGIRKAKLVLLDEPTAGVDPLTQKKVWRYIEKLKEKSVVILATHVLKEAQVLSDDILFLQKGKIVCQGAPNNLQAKRDGNYQLNVSVSPQVKKATLQTLSKWFMEDQITSHFGGHFSVDFTSDDLPFVPEVIGTLENVPGFSWSLTNSCLEKMFNELCPIADDSNKGRPNSISEMSNPFENEDSNEEGLHNQTFPIFDQHSSLHVFWNQIRTVYRTNLITVFKNRKATLGCSLLFVILLGLPLLLFGGKPHIHKLSQESETIMKSSDTGNITFLSEKVLNDKYLYSFSHFDQNPIHYSDTAEQELETLKESMWNTCTFSIEAFTNKSLEYDLTFLTPGMVVKCVEMMTNSYIQSLKDSNFLSRKKNVYEIKGTMSSLRGNLYFGVQITLAFGLLGLLVMLVCLAGYFTLHERKRGLAFMQRLQGMSAVAYWVGTLMFHFTFLTLFSIGIVVYFSQSPLKYLFKDTNMYWMFLGFETFGVFLIGFVYLFTSSLKSDSNYMVYSYLLLEVGLMMRAVDMEPLIYFSPTALVCRMMVSIAFNITNLRITWIPMILFIAYGSILLSASIIIEECRNGSLSILSGWHKRHLSFSNDSHEKGKEEFAMDDSVINERRAILNGCKNIRNQAAVLKNVSKYYKGNQALHDLYLGLPPNQCFGLLGQNGSGKTTLLNVLLGALAPDTGSVELAERGHSRSIGYCPQFAYFWNELTILQHLEMAASIRGASWSEEKTFALDMAKRLGLDLPILLHSVPGKVSLGMRRRLCLGMAMMGRPRLLILDEPTTGVDPIHQCKIWDAIKEYRSAPSSQPTSILLTTHNMSEADSLSDQIAILKSGMLQCVAPQAKLKKRFGEGYHFVIHLPLEETFKVSTVDCTVSQLVALMNKFQLKKLYQIERFFASITTPVKMVAGSYHFLFLDVDSLQQRRVIVTPLSFQQVKAQWNLQARFILPQESLPSPKLFLSIIKQLKEFGVLEWRLGSADLEDVFMNVICRL